MVEKIHGDSQCFLQCNACQWSTRESDLSDQKKSANWPEYSNPIEKQLDDVLQQMKQLGNFEKLEKGRQKQANKRYIYISLRNINF